MSALARADESDRGGFLGCRVVLLARISPPPSARLKNHFHAVSPTSTVAERSPQRSMDVRLDARERSPERSA
jgi:hypothetical protein